MLACCLDARSFQVHLKTVSILGAILFYLYIFFLAYNVQKQSSQVIIQMNKDTLKCKAIRVHSVRDFYDI